MNDDIYQFPRQKIEGIVRDLPEQVKDVYPKHLFEPERIEIARELMVKEYYKLFPFLSLDDFEQLEDTMIEWLNGRDQEMAPVHDYWNFLDGSLMGLKLKDVVPMLTSENISWKQERLDAKQLALYWPVGTLNEFDHKLEYNYDFVKTKVIGSPDVLLRNKQISDEKSADTKLSRDEFPIIVLRHSDTRLQLLDGNRRVMRSWLYDISEINAWVGTVVREPLLKNYWVPTGHLRRLIAQYAHDTRPEVKEMVRSQLDYLFVTSNIARYHYKLRCLHKPYAKELADGLIKL